MNTNYFKYHGLPDHLCLENLALNIETQHEDMGFVTQTSHPIANLLCQGYNNKDQDDVNDTDDNILDLFI